MAGSGRLGGLITGLLSGAAIGGIALAGLAVLVPPVDPPAAPGAAPRPVGEAMAVSTAENTTDALPSVNVDAAPVLPAPATPANTNTTPPVQEIPAPDRDTAEIAREDIDAADDVQTGSTGLTVPDTAANGGADAPAVAEDTAVVTPASPSALGNNEAVVAEDAPSVATDPAAPAAPQAPQTADVAPVTGAGDTEAATTTTTEMSQPVMPAAEPETPVARATSPAQAPSSEQNTGLTLPDPTGPVDAGIQLPSAPEAPTAPGTNTVVAMNDQPAPEAAPVPDQTVPAEEITLLPEASQPVDEPDGTTPDPAAFPDPPQFEGRAFDAFAVPYTAPDDRPLLAIVLEDAGAAGVPVSELLAFGPRVTFGVLADDPEARRREADYRDAGFEVLAVIPSSDAMVLTQGTASIEVSSRIGRMIRAVPGAVGVLDGADSSLYRNPKLVGTVAQSLAAEGRAFLVHEKFGVNRALEAARESGIPSAPVLRSIDEQRDSASIRRALDKAALDASKIGAAIVYGHTYPETMAAILPWLLGNTARSVNIAPLTATMKRLDPSVAGDN